MPLHVHPHLRALEEAREAVGHIVTLNSQGVVNHLADEVTGKRVKTPPAIQIRLRDGHFIPS